MRITNTMLADTTIRNLATNLARMETYSNQLTSGRRVARPSDDPVAVVGILAHQANLEQLDQHLKNIDEAASWLEVSDSALDSTGQAFQRARELAVRGASDTLTADDRLAIKAEIDALTEQIVQFANTTYGDRYIFSGTRTTTPAYASGLPPTFSGNAGGIQREIGPNTNVTISVPGQATFDPIFTALTDLSTALAADDTAAIETSLGDFASAESTLLTTRARRRCRSAPAPSSQAWSIICADARPPAREPGGHTIGGST
jgi:flagellar hook-associated protein 3 FlgL